MVKSFSAQIDDIIKTNERRIEALMRESIQEVIDEAQTPVGKGGKMRVDTGFLRASGRISFTGMPQGPIRPDDGKKYDYDAGPVELELGNLKAGGTVFFGWTAVYAAAREARDGFLESAVQNWSSIVERVTERLRKQIK